MLVIPTPITMDELEELLMEFGIMEAEDEASSARRPRKRRWLRGRLQVHAQSGLVRRRPLPRSLRPDKESSP